MVSAEMFSNEAINATHPICSNFLPSGNVFHSDLSPKDLLSISQGMPVNCFAHKNNYIARGGPRLLRNCMEATHLQGLKVNPRSKKCEVYCFKRRFSTAVGKRFQIIFLCNSDLDFNEEQLLCLIKGEGKYVF